MFLRCWISVFSCTPELKLRFSQSGKKVTFSQQMYSANGKISSWCASLTDAPSACSLIFSAVIAEVSGLKVRKMWPSVRHLIQPLRPDAAHTGMNTFHMIVKGKRGETFALKVSPSADIHTITHALHTHTIHSWCNTAEVPSPCRLPPRLKRNDRSDSSVRVTPAPSVATVIMGVNWQLCYQGGAQCRHQCLVFFVLQDNGEQISAQSISTELQSSVSRRLGEQN